MRETKFRAWHKDEKAMLFIGDDYGTRTGLDCCSYLNEGQPVILMQYTGLKDKNGVEIYEGDVLLVDSYVDDFGWKKEESKCLVDFVDGCFWGGDTELYNVANISTISGNIHETPELLNKD